MNKLQFIREKCIEANPEIVELEFGCEVKEKDSGEQFFIADRDDMDLMPDAYEIIGRPIRLADVLLAIPFKANMGIYADGTFIKRSAGDTGYEWNLKDNNLEKQSKKTIDFIYNILI